MSDDVKLSHTSALILQTISSGSRYGFDVMEVTGLPSGTVYPALRRLEQLELIHSQWEKESKAAAEQRPPRKYYRLTALGEQTLAKAVQRYPLLQHVTLSDRGEKAKRG
jgi:PadR family transcriptional regulator, regulatory protein PadR